MKKRNILVFAFAVTMMANAQIDLVKKTSKNKTAAAQKNFRFTTLIDLSKTPVESQGLSGTCWSYSTNSFLESEMIKKGKSPVHLSKIYTARYAYKEKANAYVLMQGNIAWGDGGEAHDVVNMLKKYGAMPEVSYSGLVGGRKVNTFAPMQKKLKRILDSVVGIKGKIDAAAWKAEFEKVLDDSLGVVPGVFTYRGKSYTPKAFVKKEMGLDPDDYVEFISQNTTPYYKKAMMMAPDNWYGQWDYNVTPTDLVDLVDNALKQGYTVSWGGDVSEPYFNWPNGVAFVPKNARSLEGKTLTNTEKAALYSGDTTEMRITPKNRQEGLDDGTTTDDHGMHIVGLAKDQSGRSFYVVKNSWGNANAYKGFLYVSKAYLKYKTTGLLVNKRAVPRTLRRKLKIRL